MSAIEKFPLGLKKINTLRNRSTLGDFQILVIGAGNGNESSLLWLMLEGEEIE